MVTENQTWSIIVRTGKNQHSFLPGTQKTVPKQFLERRITEGSLTTYCRQSNAELSRERQVQKTTSTVCRAISPCSVRLETVRHLSQKGLSRWSSRNDHSVITWPGVRKPSAMGITWRRLVALMVELVIKRSFRAFARCVTPKEKTSRSDTVVKEG